jgi:hypothetical protein
MLEPSLISEAGGAPIGSATGAGLKQGALIRPDACIAWAGEENSTDVLEETLHRWLRSLQLGFQVIPTENC